jgi:hypothetical protein
MPFCDDSMKKVYESADGLMVGHIKNLLISGGIQSVIKNEYLANAIGGIPPNECWYEIWVTNELQYDDAKKIIENALSNEEGPNLPWICPGCGEEHESQFTVCWKCGREMP